MIVVGDALELPLRDRSVQCVVTSPPYWGLRKYAGAQDLVWQHDDGTEWVGALGQEPTPEMLVGHLVQVCREVRRVLKEDGTLWMNLGDSYAANRSYPVPSTKGGPKHAPAQGFEGSAMRVPTGLKAKDLIGIPWMVAFALRADGWYLRSDIIWAKPNPMPESVQDRPTRAHEYVFLLTKSARYYYDAAAIRTPYVESTRKQFEVPYAGEATKDFASSGAQNASAVKQRIVDKQRGHGRRHAGFNDRWDALTKEEQAANGANARSVWTIAPKPFRGAHFATFPPDLVEKCVKAGSKVGDVVLDPFGGSGTTALVARRLGRRGVCVDLSLEYARMARSRLDP